ncbi:hypothetical protein NQ317_006813 [Molorchus minor]|uniref:Alpha-methylacyl-CoA racemase n=1 Tax=Molorchus minor TaxID=1323400 RepID=A0ABQ9JEW8_9CUCU|nr:hypothetical protein NQ317_006813 [Molorchus minor]
MTIRLILSKIDGNTDLDCLGNGKMSCSINLKHPKGVNILKKLCSKSDVLIEPFRKGVMEKLDLGPEVLLKDNPKLIYARLSGYGQSGCFSKKAGHDINYVAMSGLLSLFGRDKNNPIPPVNLAADFGGGGLMCALGILLAIIERNTSGLGQVVDNNMVQGTAYLGSWLYRSQHLPIWGDERGKNVLDSGRHFYEVYKTKDEKYISVGALEPKFYADLLKGLGLTEAEAPQFGNRMVRHFSFSRCLCCTVLTLDEAPKHKHNTETDSFIKTDTGFSPNPTPKLSRTPARSRALDAPPNRGQHTREVLLNLGFSESSIDQLELEGIIECFKLSKLEHTDYDPNDDRMYLHEETNRPFALGRPNSVRYVLNQQSSCVTVETLQVELITDHDKIENFMEKLIDGLKEVENKTRKDSQSEEVSTMIQENEMIKMLKEIMERQEEKRQEEDKKRQEEDRKHRKEDLQKN